MDQHNIYDHSKGEATKTGRIIAYISPFREHWGSGFGAVRKGVQLGVVGHRYRFCIQHAGVPRESVLPGLINCSIATDLWVGRHTHVDPL